MSSHEKILNSLATKSIQIRLEALIDPSQVCKPFLVRKMPWNCSFCHSYMYRVNVPTDFESLEVKWCLTPHAFGCTVQCKSNATLCLNISHFILINGHNKSTIPLAFSSELDILICCHFRKANTISLSNYLDIKIFQALHISIVLRDSEGTEFKLKICSRQLENPPWLYKAFAQIEVKPIVYVICPLY